MQTLFVSDLDGTFLTKEERVSAYSCERINRLIGAGMRFTFATARSVYSAERALQGLHCNMPAVFYNGALIYDIMNKTALQAIYFETNWKQYVLSVLREHGISPLVFGAVESAETVSWIGGSETQGVQRYLARRTDDKRLHPVRSEGELLDRYVFYFECIGPREQLESAWNILKYDQRFLCIFHRETYQNDYLMEISLRNASKAKAVSFLKTALGCDKLVCFGDSSNDSDMFDVCDEKYAVMNADDWLKEKATGVVGYCEEDGVAKWLEQNSGFSCGEL